MGMSNNTGRKSAFKLLALTSTALVGLALTPSAQAQEWKGSTDGNWMDASNWEPTHVPTAADDVTIDNPTGQDARLVGAGKDAVVHNITIGKTAAGDGNGLFIEAGATLTSNQGIIGDQAGSNGSVDVGAAAFSLVQSKWTNSGSLIIGNFGSGNLSIGNGTVSNTDGMIGAKAGSFGYVALSGAGAVWTNSGSLTVGGAGSGVLDISNGGKVTDATATIGDVAGSKGTTTVSGVGSTWKNDGNLIVGSSGDGVMNVVNGATVTSHGSGIGFQSGSTGLVTVDGLGSSWTDSLDLTLGSSGGYGVLNISNGGEVSDRNGTVGAFGQGQVSVTGQGSSWSNSGELNVGYYNIGNTVTVSGGGQLSSGVSFIGVNAGSDGKVTITGAGSKWTDTGNLAVGSSGQGHLEILNGAVVTSVGSTVGFQTGSTGVVTVDGLGSSWTDSLDLTIGSSGGHGVLDISNGGKVSDRNGTVGAFGQGQVSVTGQGSSWSNSGELNVGYYNIGSTLTVAGGGSVSANLSRIGAQGGSTGTVLVTGAGSTWTNTGSLYVGDEGSGTLNISNGGKVTAGFAGVGSSVGAVGTMTVDGTNSAFVGSDNLTIGSFGSGVMAITNGGAVSNLQGTIGAVAGSEGKVTVDGPGSSWTSNFLVVGDSGNGTLDILNGGQVRDFLGALALSNVASYAFVKIEGIGSTWTNDGATIVGVNGQAQLSIFAGGHVVTGATVAGANATVGLSVNSNGSAYVDGAGSRWDVSGDMVVGDAGNGLLRLTNGGKVSIGGDLILAKTAGSTGVLNIFGSVPGTLDATKVQFGSGTGEINFQHAGTNYNFDAAVNGLGTINNKTGVTHLTADSSGFTGDTHVTGGTLLVDGKLGTGMIDVQSGGILGGYGTIGGHVAIATGGTLSGLQGQTLSMQQLTLAGGANVDVTLDTPGGAALFDVAADLTLDGTLNVTAGTPFGPGVYSLMTYGGALTDNGLDIGATPIGSTASDFLVQTAVAGQVNLVNNSLPNLGFWDGDAAGSANNNAVDGGSGVWSAASTNWTDFNGTTNGVMHPQPGFAIFQGTAGTVTADASAGDIAVTGMQFASDGYQITGAPITLADASSIIRVGDGSAAGAGFTATIGSALTGTGGLNKTDLGTLILTGNNDYTGGTTISGGTLRLGNGGTTGSIAGDILNKGILVFNRADAVTFAGAISGNGAIEQAGAGTTNLTGNSGAFTGSVVVNGGGLAVKGGGTLGSSTFYAAVETGSSGAVTVDGAGSALTSAGPLIIGARGTASLTVSNGATLSDDEAFLAYFAGSSGTATVDGPGSSWTNTGNLTIGSAGSGALAITNGGAVSNLTGLVGFGAGSTGTVSVTGPGSIWQATTVGIGVGGTGTLSITNGGIVADGGAGSGSVVGAASGSSGMATVDGAGSKWVNSGTFMVGNLGTGTLHVTSGGAVSNDAGYIGFKTGSTGTATVDGAGSTWTNIGNLSVGQGGNGRLDITNGGKVSGKAGYLGFEGGSTGTATVSGAGSTWNNALGIAIGVGGTGSLTIADKGVVVSGGEGIVGASAGSSGTVAVTGAGSAWTNIADLTIGADGTGALAISNGAAVTNATGFIGRGLGSSGTVSVDGTGSSWVNTNLAVSGLGAGTLSITNGGSVRNDVAAVASHVGVAGSVRVDGAGSSWTNTGQALIGQFGDGTLTIANNGVVTVGGTFTLASSASSTGVLNIGAANGSAAVGAGTLNAASLQFGNGSGVVNFNHTSSNYLFSTNMAGAGTINQLAGNTNLTGSSGGFAGAVNVKGGRLAVNGLLAGGQVTVGAGATLGGNGVIGSLTAQSGAIVAPGNSIGTLNVAGNASFASGSIYQVELNGLGQSDLLNVAGSVNIANGAQLSVIKTDAVPYVLGTHYNIIKAGGALTGGFSFDTIKLTNFMGLVVGSDAHSVYLDVAKTKTFAAAGMTANEKATGQGLDSLPLSSVLVGAVANLPSDAAAQAAFNQLSGEIHASMASGMIEDSRIVRESMLDRLRGTIDAASGTTDGSVSVWGRGFGQRSRLKGDGNAATLKHDDSGILMGADGMVGSSVRVGFVGGYSHSTFNDAGRNSHGESDNYHVGAYGGAQLGQFSFRTGLGYTLHDVKATRTVNFAGFSDALSSDYQARTTQAFGEIAYALPVGKATLEPFANVAYVDQSSNRFTEKGGAAALSGKGGQTNVTFSTLGLRGVSRFDLGGGTTLKLRGSAGWRHAFGDLTPDAPMAFANGASFSIAGVPVTREAAVVDLGADVNLSEKISFGLSYGGQFGSGSSSNSVRATLAVKF